MAYKTTQEIEKIKLEKIFGLNRFQIFCVNRLGMLNFGRSLVSLEQIAKNIEKFDSDSIPQNSNSIEQAKKLVEEYKRDSFESGGFFDTRYRLDEVEHDKTGNVKYRLRSFWGH